MWRAKCRGGLGRACRWLLVLYTTGDVYVKDLSRGSYTLASHLMVVRGNWTTEYLKATFAKRLSFVATHLGDAAYIVSDRFSAADISVGYTIGMARFAADIEPSIKTASLLRALEGAARLSASCESLKLTVKGTSAPKSQSSYGTISTGV